MAPPQAAPTKRMKASKGKRLHKDHYRPCLPNWSKRKKDSSSRSGSDPVWDSASSGYGPQSQETLLLCTSYARTRDEESRLNTPTKEEEESRSGQLQRIAFAGDPLSGKTMAHKGESVSKSIQKKIWKVRDRRPTETDRLRCTPGWLYFDTKLRQRIDGKDFLEIQEEANEAKAGHPSQDATSTLKRWQIGHAK